MAVYVTNAEENRRDEANGAKETPDGGERLPRNSGVAKETVSNVS